MYVSILCVCVCVLVCERCVLLDSLINGDGLIPSIGERDHTDGSCDDDVMFQTVQALPWRRIPSDENNASAVVGRAKNYLFQIPLPFEGPGSWAVLRSLPILLRDHQRN